MTYAGIVRLDFKVTLLTLSIMTHNLTTPVEIPIDFLVIVSISVDKITRITRTNGILSEKNLV